MELNSYFCTHNRNYYNLIEHRKHIEPQLKYLNMKVKVTNAIKQLFGTTTSFDMVYYEAVANSLDANAQNINILIEADNTNDIENFKLTIHDDDIPNLGIYLMQKKLAIEELDD